MQESGKRRLMEGGGRGKKVLSTGKQSFVSLKHLSCLPEEFTVPTVQSTELGVEAVGVGGVPKSQEVRAGMSTRPKGSSLQSWWCVPLVLSGRGQKPEVGVFLRTP